MPSKRELHEITLRPAKGGFVAEKRYRTKRSGQGGGPDYDFEHETSVHKGDLGTLMERMMAEPEPAKEPKE